MAEMITLNEKALMDAHEAIWDRSQVVCSTADIAAAITAYLQSSGLGSAGGVGVKALEWNGCSGRNSMGSYRTGYHDNGQPWGYPERGPGFYAELDQGFGVLVSGPHDTRKEAEESADAHYEQRIRSALVATPKPEATVFAMTDEQIVQWVDACNHEPAKATLRHYLVLRAKPEPTEGGAHEYATKRGKLDYADRKSTADNPYVVLANAWQDGFDDADVCAPTLQEPTEGGEA